MLNHKTIFKQKSKILLIILSIFGLLFSYSCSCRNPNKPPSGGGNFAPKANPSSQLSLIASEDGTTKTEVAISFFEENSHNIKSAKVTKIVDTNGNDITDKATYVFSDGKFSFNNQSDLKGVLDGMVSTSAPATNTLTVTFEITTDSTEVLNTTATVDVNVYLVKTQKFDNQATILQGIVSRIGRVTIDKWNIFEFDTIGKAEINKIELSNSDDSEPAQGQHSPSASAFINDIINNNNKAIKNDSEYQKYFDDVVGSVVGGEVDTTSTKLNFTLTFTPKNIYDMALTAYDVKLDTADSTWLK